jgi:transposase-like protein
MNTQKKQERRKFTTEFKKEAIRLLDTRRKGGRELEQELGLSVGQIYRWRKELRIDGKNAFPGNGNPRDEELAKLRKENAILREERDILRKAMAIFSRIQK